jgi:hypothetical protein
LRKQAKKKNIKVAIKSDEDIFQEVKKTIGKIERGEKVKKHEGISFGNCAISSMTVASGVLPWKANG